MNAQIGISPQWESLFTERLLQDGESLFFDFQIENCPDLLSGQGTAHRTGILIDGEFYTPTHGIWVSNQPKLPVPINGWFLWRNKDNLTLTELLAKTLPFDLTIKEPISRIIREEHIAENIEKDFMIVFGAGASYADGVPVQAKLLRNIIDQDDPEVRESRAYKVALDFLETFFVWDEERDQYPSLEQVFGFIEYFLITQTSIGGKFNTFHLDAVKDYLIRLMHREIRLSVEKAQKQDGFVSAYRDLLYNILRFDRSCSFVTLNYDKLLSDNFAYIFPFNIYVDYGIDLVNYERMHSQDYTLNWINPKQRVFSPINFPAKKINTIKLHGSINWKYCDACHSVFVSDWKNLINVNPRAIYFDEELTDATHDDPENSCHVCANKLDSIVVPPTHIKNFNHPIYRELHGFFNTELRNTDKLIFVGYSMPEADVHIKAILSTHYAKNIKSVHLVDPEPSKNAVLSLKSICDDTTIHTVTMSDFVNDKKLFEAITSPSATAGECRRRRSW